LVPFIFCYGLDLLVVVSLFLSAFSPLLYSMMCILVFVSLYYLVCSSNKFTFLFFGTSSAHVRAFFSLCFLSFPSFKFIAYFVATLSVKNNFLWWVVNHCPLFLYLAVLFFIHPILLDLLLSKFQNWWIIRLRVPNSISKISIAYVFYKPPQSDIIVNLRHLARTGQAYCLRSVITFPWLLC